MNDSNYKNRDYFEHYKNWCLDDTKYWKNAFFLTVRSKQFTNYPLLSVSESIERDLILARNVFEKSLFGARNHKRRNGQRKKIGMWAVVENSNIHNFGYHAHLIVEVPAGFESVDIKRRFYSAWLRTDMFGQRGFAPSIEEKKLLRQSFNDIQNIVDCSPVYSDDVVGYLMKGYSKTGDENILIRLIQKPSF